MNQHTAAKKCGCNSSCAVIQGALNFLHRIGAIDIFSAVIRIKVIGVLLLVAAVSLKAQNRLPSNQQLLEKFIAADLDSLGRLIPGDSVSIQLQASGLRGEQRAFVHGQFNQVFSSDRFRLKTKNADWVVTINRFSADFRYHESGRRLLGFSKRLRRELNYSIGGWIEDTGSKQITRSFLIKKANTDLIDSDKVGELEQSPYFFCRGQMITHSLWTKYLEPALIIVSVTAVVYLFFSVRS